MGAGGVDVSWTSTVSGHVWGACGLGGVVWVERVGVQHPDGIGADGAQRMLDGVAVDGIVLSLSIERGVVVVVVVGLGVVGVGGVTVVVGGVGVGLRCLWRRLRHWSRSCLICWSRLVLGVVVVVGGTGDVVGVEVSADGVFGIAVDGIVLSLFISDVGGVLGVVVGDGVSIIVVGGGG